MPCPYESRTNELSLRSVVRLLPFERKVVVVVRFRNGANTFDNRLPVIASILAVKNIAVRGAGEKGITTVPDVHRHAFDIGADVFG